MTHKIPLKVHILHQQAKKYNCTKEVWNLWVQNSKLSDLEKEYIAREWQNGTLSLIVDDAEYWKLTKIPD